MIYYFFYGHVKLWRFLHFWLYGGRCVQEHSLDNDTILVDDYGENEFQILLSEYQEYKRRFYQNYLDFFENITHKGYPFKTNLTGKTAYECIVTGGVHVDDDCMEDVIENGIQICYEKKELVFVVHVTVVNLRSL